MTPDLHALISQMAAELDHCQQLLRDDRRQRHPLADRARALLAEADGPAVPDGREPASVALQPSDEELETFLVDAACQNGDIYYADPKVLARAALARWGRPTPQPPADGEVAELVAELRHFVAGYQQMRGLDPEHVYSIHRGDAMEAHLRISRLSRIAELLTQPVEQLHSTRQAPA